MTFAIGLPVTGCSDCGRHVSENTSSSRTPKLKNLKVFSFCCIKYQYAIAVPRPGARSLSVAALTLIVFNLAGCSKESPPPTLGTFHMGERIQVGPMTYNVLESRWKPALRDDGTGKPPKERYLLVKLTATNGGGSTGQQFRVSRS